MNLLKLRVSMIGTLVLIIAISTLFFTAIFSYFGANLLIIVIFIVPFNLIQWLLAPYLVDALYGVKEMTPSQYPRIKNIVSNICQKTGMAVPKLMLANITIPNAFAYGSPITGNRVAVTQGLLSTLEEEEVEAVLGHELGHLKHRDVQIVMFASFLPAIVYYIGYSLMLSSLYGGSTQRNSGGVAILIGLVAMALYWVLNLFVLGLSRLREYYADRHSVQNVPDGARKMSEALAKIVIYTRRPAQQNRALGMNSFRCLFITDPGTAQNDADLISRSRLGDSQMVREVLSRKITTLDRITEVLSTHPNIVKRLRALQETT